MGHPTGNFGLVGRCGCQCGLLGLRLSSRPSGMAAPVAPAPQAAPDGTALARLLGAVPAGLAAAPVAVAAPSSRFALLGVLSGRSSGGGAALISGWQTGPPVPRGRAGGFGAGAAVAGARARRRWVRRWMAPPRCAWRCLPRADGFFIHRACFLGLTPAVVGRRAFSSTTRYVCCTGASPVKPGRTITQSPSLALPAAIGAIAAVCLRDCSATPRSA